MHYNIQPLVGRFFGMQIQVFTLMSGMTGLFLSVLLAAWTPVPYGLLGPGCLLTAWFVARLTLIPIQLTGVFTPLWGKRGWYA